MSLTRGQIEWWRDYLAGKLFFGESKNVADLNALCDTALLSLQQGEPVAWGYAQCSHMPCRERGACCWPMDCELAHPPVQPGLEQIAQMVENWPLHPANVHDLAAAIRALGGVVQPGLEEAAKVCEAQFRDDDVKNDEARTWNAAAYTCAAAIRSLSTEAGKVKEEGKC